MQVKIFRICFFGSDSSGESTLAKYVAKYLEYRGIWLRATHTFASVLARFLSRFGAFHDARHFQLL